MNRNIILIALLGLLSIGKVTAQSVTVEAKIDSLQILIGEQAKLQLQVAMDARQRAIFPAYLSNRTVGNFINAVSYLEEACKNCDKEAIYANVRSINSYLGFLIHYQSYGIRRKAFSELHYFWKACYIQGKFQVVKIKNTVQCL